MPDTHILPEQDFLQIKHHSSHPTKSTDNKIPQNCMDSEGDTDLLIL